MTTFRHGVRVIENTSGARPIQLGSTTRFGMVGIAPDAQAAISASFTFNESSGVADNNGIVFTADAAGANGNAITVKFVDPGTVSASLSVSVTNNAITVNLATDGSGDISSTAAQVISAIEADTDAAALVDVADYSTSDGSGLVTALNSTNLTGGEDEPFPLNTPVLVNSNDRDLINKLGAAGTLKENLDTLFTVTGAAGVVVRVASDVTPATEQANVAGSSVSRTGFHALLDAEALTGIKPKWLVAPYYTEFIAVANEGLAVAAKLKAVILIDADEAATEATAMTYAENFGLGRNPVLHPWDKVQADDGSIVQRPSSQITLGVCILNDKERGFWTSPSNRSYPIAVGQARTIDYSLDDPDSRANLLNENNVTTKINLGSGLLLWGNRSNSTDTKYSFLVVRRTADAIAEAIQAAHVWAIDENITGQYFKSVIDSVNQFLRSLEAQGAILGGECWADPEKNTAASMAANKVFFNYKITPNAPAEDITFEYQITDEYFSTVIG